MPQSKTYRLDIAPLTPLPLTRSPFFSYRSDRDLPLGSLVQVPFGRRSLRGIVYESALLPGRPPLWMKPIERVIVPGWLDASQRALAQWISETYFSSLGNSLKHFVFPLPKKAAQAPAQIEPKKKRRTRSKTLAREFASEGALAAWFLALAATHREKGTRCLILMPDLLQVALWERRLRAHLGDALVTITSRLTAKEQWQAWQALRTQGTAIVIGTRQALFAPLGQLKDIVVVAPEETLSYKQWDMTPYYEAGEAARFLAERSGASLTWASTSLGLRERRLLGERTNPPIAPPIVIDRRLDGKGARSKAIGKELLTRLKEALGHGPILLIAKERGVSGITVCQSCRTVARCPTCEHLLGEAEAGHLRCLSCGYASDDFPRCRSCGGLHFQGYGMGTVRATRELERLLPASRILRLDRDQLARKTDWKRLVDKLGAGQFDILVTTQEMGSLLPLHELSLAALLEGDQLLAQHHYANEERLVLLVKRLTAKLGPRGVLVLQTFSPEERVWQALAGPGPDAFLSTLDEERSLLGYPPAAAMIQLAPGKDSRLTRAAFATLRERLLAITRDWPELKVSPLYEQAYGGRRAGPSCIIKHPADQPLPPAVLDWLRRESRHLRIDVHPFRV